MSDEIGRLWINLTLTNNNDGRTHAWAKAMRSRRKIEKLLMQSIGQRKPFEHPVRLTIVRVLGKGQRLWDYDSGLRGNAKELIDSLVATGWFHDDNPKWIKGVNFEQDDTQRASGPAVVVVIHRAGD